MLLILLNGGVDHHLSTSTYPPIYHHLSTSIYLPPPYHQWVSVLCSSTGQKQRPPTPPNNPRLLVITSLPSTSLPLPPLPYPASHHSKGSRKRVGLSDALVECRGERPSSLSVCEREQERGGGGEEEEEKEEGSAAGERNRHGF